MKDTCTYTIKIVEVIESDTSDFLSVECKLNANSDSVAAEIMSDLLISFAKHNHLEISDLDANLYKTQWINGI